MRKHYEKLGIPLVPREPLDGQSSAHTLELPSDHPANPLASSSALASADPSASHACGSGGSACSAASVAGMHPDTSVSASSCEKRPREPLKDKQESHPETRRSKDAPRKDAPHPKCAPPSKGGGFSPSTRDPPLEALAETATSPPRSGAPTHGHPMHPIPSGGGASWLSRGMSVEVRMAEDGLCGSMYKASVVKLGELKALVEFHSFNAGENGKKATQLLKEWVEHSRLQPLPPPIPPDFFVRLQPGDLVDMWYDHGWWEVEVIEKIPGKTPGRSGAGSVDWFDFEVYAHMYSKRRRVPMSRVRPHWVWEGVIDDRKCWRASAPSGLEGFEHASPKMINPQAKKGAKSAKKSKSANGKHASVGGGATTQGGGATTQGGGATTHEGSPSSSKPLSLVTSAGGHALVGGGALPRSKDARLREEIRQAEQVREHL